MKKIDKVIVKNTLFVTVWVLIFSALMQAIFLVSGFWNYTVILGNLLGAIIGIGNFFLLGLTVQKALTMETNKAKLYMTWSKRIRMFLILIIAIVGAVLSVFNTIALLISLIFPRLALLIYSLRSKKHMEQFEINPDNVVKIDDNELADGTIEEVENTENTENTINTENINNKMNTENPVNNSVENNNKATDISENKEETSDTGSKEGR